MKIISDERKAELRRVLLSATKIAEEQAALFKEFRDLKMVAKEEAQKEIAEQEKKIVELRWCLEMLEGGDYGFCRNCENEIEVGRLRSLPLAEFCIKCEQVKRAVEAFELRKAVLTRTDLPLFRRTP